MSVERDNNGRFKKGSSGNPKTQFRGGIAEEMQARSVQARKEKKALADVVREALEKKMASGNITRMEFLAEKAIADHARGEMTFKDLRDLQKLLGEDVKKVEFGTEPLNITLADGSAMEGLKRALETGAKPRKPENEEEETE